MHPCRKGMFKLNCCDLVATKFAHLCDYLYNVETITDENDLTYLSRLQAFGAMRILGGF